MRSKINKNSSLLNINYSLFKGGGWKNRAEQGCRDNLYYRLKCQTNFITVITGHPVNYIAPYEHQGRKKYQGGGDRM